MKFANPIFLYSLIFLLPTLTLFVLWATRRQKTALKRLGNPSLVQRLTANVNWRGRRWQTLLWFLALVALVTALARPQWGTETREVEQEGIEVMVALDVSNSMLAQDIKPDRLSRAKQALYKLIDKLQGDRIGIIIFAGKAYTQLPITTDYAAAKMFVSTISPKDIPSQGTAIGEAIGLGIESFD